MDRPLPSSRYAPSHWLAAMARDRRLIGFFERYCRVVFDRYKEKVKYWMTFNEINALFQPFEEEIVEFPLFGFT